MKKFFLKLVCKLLGFNLQGVEIEDQQYYLLSTDSIKTEWDKDLFTSFCRSVFSLNGHDIQSFKDKLKPAKPMPEKNREVVMKAFQEDKAIGFTKDGIDVV
jgi:hypothetical protein